MKKKEYFVRVTIVATDLELLEVQAVNHDGEEWAVLFEHEKMVKCENAYGKNVQLEPEMEEEIRRKISLRGILNNQPRRFNAFKSDYQIAAIHHFSTKMAK